MFSGHKDYYSAKSDFLSALFSYELSVFLQQSEKKKQFRLSFIIFLWK